MVAKSPRFLRVKSAGYSPACSPTSAPAVTAYAQFAALPPCRTAADTALPPPLGFL